MAHDTHHDKKEKKVYFAPAVIMGLSFWLFAFFFLSLCNKKEHHDAEVHGSSHEEHSSLSNHKELSPENSAVEDSMEVELIDMEGYVEVRKIPFPTNTINVLLKFNDKLLQSEYSQSQFKSINEINFIDSVSYSNNKTDLVYECKGLSIFGKINDKLYIAESFSNKLTDEMKKNLNNADLNSKIIVEAMLLDEKGIKFKISKSFIVKK